MGTSRIVKAIEDVALVVAASQIASQGIIDDPDGAIVTAASSEIIAGNSARLVFISNIDNTKEVYLAVDMDAVAETGIVIFPGKSTILPLGEGRGLNAITASSTAKLSWQAFS